MLDFLVGLANEQDSDMVVPTKENEMNRGQWKVRILEQSPTPPEVIVISKKKLHLQLWEVFICRQRSLIGSNSQHFNLFPKVTIGAV